MVKCLFKSRYKDKKMTVLQLLFGIDALLNIEDGFIYDIDKIKISNNRDNFTAGGGCGDG